MSWTSRSAVDLLTGLKRRAGETAREKGKELFFPHLQDKTFSSDCVWEGALWQ